MHRDWSEPSDLNLLNFNCKEKWSFITSWSDDTWQDALCLLLATWISLFFSRGWFLFYIFDRWISLFGTSDNGMFRTSGVIRPPGFDSPATRRTMHLRPSPSPPSILPGLGLGQHLQTNGPAPQIASRAAVAVSNLWRCTDCLCEMYIRCSIVQIVNVILLHRVCPCKESRIPFVLLSCVISCPPIWP